MSDPDSKGHLDRNGLFIACKMIALVQCDVPLTIDNARIECKAPNFGPETAPGAPTAAAGPPSVNKLPVKMAINFLVKPEEKRKYDTLFDQLQPEDEKITGEKVYYRKEFSIISKICLAIDFAPANLIANQKIPNLTSIKILSSFIESVIS